MSTTSPRSAPADGGDELIFRPPNGPDPLPSPPEPPPPTTLSGAIGARWKALGGAAWGTPSFKPMSTGNGGLWVQFSHRDGSLSSIIWSSATGARVVRQFVNDAYARINRMNGPLGFPTTDDMPTHDGVGRFQMFQGGVVVWHPRIGAFEVHGAISARYLAAGGTTFGYPITNETATPDGRGRFNHFRHLESNSERSIYWTPQTGAHEVYGFIRGRWVDLGWERSPLGYPTSPELNTHDNRGRYQTFEGGSMVWSPTTGAHAVHGQVLARYGALGGSAYGYPTNEVNKTPDGRGRYQHYLDLASNSTRSIYWSPSTGAHEVYGLIRRRWSDTGWERGHLGYPTGKEEPWSGRPGGRSQTFQGGMIYYSRETDAYADPMRWTQHFSGGGFRGDVAVVSDSSGRVRLDGRAECGWPAKFSYLVQTMVTSSANEAIVLPHKGKLTAVTQSDQDTFHDDFVDGLVAAGFPAFSRGSLRVDHQHSNDVTKFIGDITDGLIKWTVGELLITPGNGLILLGAAELYSALTGGGVAGGARIASGMMWLAGPAGTVIALAADGLARLASSDKPLGVNEYEVAQMVFKGTLPSREDIRISDGIGSGGKAFTFPRWDGKMVISLGDDAGNPMGARDDRCTHDGQLLIHELTHVWHYHNTPALLRYVGDRIFGDQDHPGEFPRGDWESAFSQEQRCVIVDEWFARHYDPSTHTKDQGYGLALNDALTDTSFEYIRDEVRKRHAPAP
jgi:uncharacterized protein with LGFP repeats